jgi:hypothetical protein
MKTFISVTIIACSVALLTANARAVVTVTGVDSTSDNNYDGQITTVPSTDLIYNNVGTLTDGLPAGTVDYGAPYNTTGPTNTGPDIGFTIKGLTDGLSTDGQDVTQTFFGTTHFDNAFSVSNFGNSLNYDPIVTYNLGSSLTGYTLTSIKSIFGYSNESSFADQNYTIKYTTVAGGNTNWFTLTSVAYNPFAPPSTDVISGVGATDVTVTNPLVSNPLIDVPLAVGVTQIQFDFSPYVDSAVNSPTGQEQFGQVIRELQVDGAATVPADVPEPSTWAMMIVGAAGALVLSLRRLVRA